MEMVKKISSFLMKTDKDLADFDSLNEVLIDYSGVTTAHGIPRIITSRSVMSRLFWSFVTLVALGAFLWQGSQLLLDYKAHPYTTQIDVVTRTKLQFPAVTVCNMNNMRRSAMANTRFESLIRADGGATEEDDDFSWWFDSPLEWLRRDEDEELASAYALVTGSGSESSGDLTTDGSIIYPMTNFTEIPDGNNSINEPSSPPTESHPIATDTGTAAATSDAETDTTSFGGITPFIDQGSSVTDQGEPLKRRRRFSLRLIPDPVDGKLSQRPHVRQTRQTDTRDDYSKQYDWWDPRWDTDAFDYHSYDWNDVEDDNDWIGFYRQSKTDDFSDLLEVINPTREELKVMGHQAEDFLLQCTFDRRQCNYTDFRQFQNKYYGNCYTFNQVVGNSTGARSTGRTGAQYGLHLTLFTEQPEYVGLFTQEAGVRVAIHPPNVFPFPEDDGVVASTGQATYIGLRQVCRQAIEQFFHDGQLLCYCPVACEETLFVTDVTSSLWPSERYEGHLKNRLTNEKAKRILEDVGQTRKNLARVRIYFEELNYEQMIQKPKYTIESLLGGIGGLLGFYIGFSVLTICEVGGLVVDLFKFLFRKAYNRDKVVPVDFKC